MAAPGVQITERTINQSVNILVSSAAAVVGAVNRGRSFQRILVPTINQLKSWYGVGDATVGFLQYSAAAFLAQSQVLYVTRVHNGALFAGAVVNSGSGNVTLVSNENDATGSGGIVAQEINSTANGSSVTFAFTVAHHPIQTSTYTIKFTIGSTVYTGTDNGSGSITGVNISSGTINYSSGAVSVTFSTPPANTTSIISGYNYGATTFSFSLLSTPVGVGTVSIAYNVAAGVQTGEVDAAGNGSTTSFNFTLSKSIVVPSSLVITYTISSVVHTATDNGTGTLTGSSLSAGTINYTTGAVSLTFSTAPSASTNISSSYQYSIVFTATDPGGSGVLTGANLTSGTINYTTGAVVLTFSTPVLNLTAISTTYNQQSPATTALTTGISGTYSNGVLTALPYTFTGSQLFLITADNEGTWGNFTKVIMGRWRTATAKTSPYSFTMWVYDTTTGTSVLQETWQVSRKTQITPSGSQLYIQTVLNNSSNYIRVVDNTVVSNTTMPMFTVTGESFATGDGTTTTFSYTTLRNPIDPGSIVILQAGVAVATDQGGGIFGSGISGTVNYTTGAISITFASAPTSGVAITVSYYFQIVVTLSQGTNGSAVTDGNVNAGWNLYQNKTSVTVRIFINNGYTDETVQANMDTICQNRQDCMSILDVPSTPQDSASVINFRNVTQNLNSSYSALYTPWATIYDNDSNMNVNVPISGYIAGAYAYNDLNYGFWEAPAGPNHAPITVKSLTYSYDPNADVDVMYQNQVNAVVSFPGEGIYPMGQKTLYNSDSPLNRVNVRRDLIIIESAIAKAARFSAWWEINNAATRSGVVSQLNDYFAYLQTLGAVNNGPNSYLVICDTSNNTSIILANHQLVITIYVQVPSVAEFILITVNVSASSITTNESVASALPSPTVIQ